MKAKQSSLEALSTPITGDAAIAPFAFKTVTLPPATTTNTIFLGTKEIIIVDPATSFEEEHGKFDDLLEKRISKGVKLTAIILTHHHHDHVGDALRVSTKYKVPIWAHELTARKTNLSCARFLHDDELVFTDSNTRAFRVIFTPGHAAGHICLFDSGSKILIAGDMVASQGSILIDPNEGNLKQYLASLDQLINLGPSTVVPSHGSASDGDTLLRSTREHRLLRLSQVLKLIPESKKSALSPEALVKPVYGDTLAPFMNEFALRSIISMFIFLEKRGEIVRVGGKNIFWAPPFAKSK